MGRCLYIALNPTEQHLVIEPTNELKNQTLNLLSYLMDFNYKVVTK